MTTMLASLSAAMDRAGMTAHREAARPADSRGASNMTQPGSGQRSMFAVTVALSEPAGSTPLDWPEAVASVLRLAFAETSVHVIDTWRCDR